MKIPGNINGILLGENDLNDILTRNYRKKVLRVETHRDEFKVFFDRSEDINAIILDKDDLGKVLKEFYGKNVLDVLSLSHEEYLVKFVR